jgi:hypothetical protein
LTGDLGQWLVLHKDRPQGFVLAVQGGNGVKEEVSTAGVVHGATSEEGSSGECVFCS